MQFETSYQIAADSKEGNNSLYRLQVKFTSSRKERACTGIFSTHNMIAKCPSLLNTGGRSALCPWKHWKKISKIQKKVVVAG